MKIFQKNLLSIVLRWPKWSDFSTFVKRFLHRSGEFVSFTDNTFGVSSGMSNLILAPNSYMYSVPYDLIGNPTIYKVEPVYMHAEIFKDLSYESFTEGVLANNGKIYMVSTYPYIDPELGGQMYFRVMVIDPEDANYTEYIKLDFVDYWVNDYYKTIIKGKNGKLYLIPYNGMYVFEIDPFDHSKSKPLYYYTFELGLNFLGGCLAPNGKIYCSNHSQDKILEIDTTSEDAIMSKIGLPSPSVGYIFGSASLALNGKIYFAPYDSRRILEFDPENVNGSKFVGPVFEESLKCIGSILGPDGNIYCTMERSGYDQYRILKIVVNDLDSSSVIILNDYIFNNINTLFIKGTLAPNNTILLAPVNLASDPVAPLQINFTNTSDLQVCLSPFLK